MSNEVDKFERIKSVEKLGCEVEIVDHDSIVKLSIPSEYHNSNTYKLIPFNKLDDFVYVESVMKQVLVDEKEVLTSLLEKETVGKEFVDGLKKALNSLDHLIEQFVHVDKLN